MSAWGLIPRLNRLGIRRGFGMNLEIGNLRFGGIEGQAMYWDQETLYAVIFILTAWSAGNIMFR